MTTQNSVSAQHCDELITRSLQKGIRFEKASCNGYYNWKGASTMQATHSASSTNPSKTRDFNQWTPPRGTSLKPQTQRGVRWCQNTRYNLRNKQKRKANIRGFRRSGYVHSSEIQRRTNLTSNNAVPPSKLKLPASLSCPTTTLRQRHSQATAERKASSAQRPKPSASCNSLSAYRVTFDNLGQELFLHVTGVRDRL